MLTLDRAKDSVALVMDSLHDPKTTLAREDMGPLHAALAPHLRNWMKDGENEKRDVLLVTAVGSINYDCVVPGSDLDMKAVYLPSARDFYCGNFPKYSFVTDEFDCELHPVHHFIEHMLKGNINFFEPLYAKAALARPDFWYILATIVKPLVEMNVARTAYASYYTAKSQDKGAGYVQNEENFNFKAASHSIRLLAFLIHLLDTGEINIVPSESFRNAVKRLKTGSMTMAEYRGLYTELEDTARNLMFVNGDDKAELSDRVMNLDQSSSKEWKELRQQLEGEMVKTFEEHVRRCL